MKPAIVNKNLKLLTYINTNLPFIMGDKNRLSQVLKNLLVNALKFTDKGTITISTKIDENQILFSIEDTGIGIRNDELTKIFTKFYQAYTGDDRKQEGTGLGLFICKQIIEKHNAG